MEALILRIAYFLGTLNIETPVRPYEPLVKPYEILLGPIEPLL